jgi:hypothetical protein
MTKDDGLIRWPDKIAAALLQALESINAVRDSRLVLAESDRPPGHDRKNDYNVLWRWRHIGRVWRHEYRNHPRTGMGPWHWLEYSRKVMTTKLATLKPVPGLTCPVPGADRPRNKPAAYYLVGYWIVAVAALCRRASLSALPNNLLGQPDPSHPVEATKTAAQVFSQHIKPVRSASLYHGIRRSNLRRHYWAGPGHV